MTDNVAGRAAAAYLAKMPPSEQGHGGDIALFRAAYVLTHGFALSEDLGLQLLREFNLRSVPPWSEEDLRRKYWSAARTRGPIGYLLDKGGACNRSPARGTPWKHSPNHLPFGQSYQTEQHTQPPISTEQESMWIAAQQCLAAAPALQASIEHWRSWPVGSVAQLIEEGLIGSALLEGKPSVAFPVQAPVVSGSGAVGVRIVGLHQREASVLAAKAPWSFYPNQMTHGYSCPALPFVVGAGFIRTAEAVVITEGQWDCLTLALAGGWLNSDAAFPENVVLFGVRGATSWRKLIDHWSHLWPKSARMVVVPDADAAGDGWSKPYGLIHTLRALGHHVSLRRSRVPHAKDVNDLHRDAPLSSADVADLISAGRAA